MSDMRLIQNEHGFVYRYTGDTPPEGWQWYGCEPWRPGERIEGTFNDLDKVSGLESEQASSQNEGGF